VPISPAPATEDPSSSLVLAGGPPPSTIIGEHDCALSLHPNGLTPHLLPPSPTATPSTSSVTGHCGWIKNSFFDLFNFKNISKLQKFLKTCGNVQKWQTKFCWTPLGEVYLVDVTKFTFVQYFIVQNYKNSNAKINVYKYLHVQLF
jgi:hypothetical protein